MQTVIKNLPLKPKLGARSQKLELFHDDASGLRSLEERERQRVLGILDFATSIAIAVVGGMMLMALLTSL